MAGSKAYGFMYLVTPSTHTQTLLATAEKATMASTSVFGVPAKNVLHTSPNRLWNVSDETLTFEVTASISARIVAGTDPQEMDIRLVKNGTTPLGVPGKLGMQGTGNHAEGTIVDLVSLDPKDYLELWVQLINQFDQVLITDMNFRIVAVD